MVKYPIAKGFYSFDREELIKQIERCFLDKKFGPGYIPSEIKMNKKLLAGIVPHAGYEFSGPCAAFTYKELYENYNFDTIIIVGTNHYGIGSNISLLLDDWYTPLGYVESDKEFIKKILDSFDAVEDPIAFKYEHSIEVQLPFLKYLFDDKFKIVPILIKDLNLEKIRDFVRVIDNVSKELNREIFILSSGDFTHHGEIYDYTYFKENIIDNVKEMDLEYIDKIVKLDSEGLRDLIKKYNGTVCGIYPFIFFIEYTKYKKGRVELLRYYNSGEKTLNDDIVVGYGSIISYI